MQRVNEKCNRLLTFDPWLQICELCIIQSQIYIYYMKVHLHQSSPIFISDGKKLEGRTIYSSLLLFIVRMVAFPKTSSPQIGGNSYACNICFWIINWFIDKLIGWSHIFTPCRSRLVRTDYVQSCIDLTVYHAINNQLIGACMQVYIVDVYNIVR